MLMVSLPSTLLLHKTALHCLRIISSFAVHLRHLSYKTVVALTRLLLLLQLVILLPLVSQPLTPLSLFLTLPSVAHWVLLDKSLVTLLVILQVLLIRQIWLTSQRLLLLT